MTEPSPLLDRLRRHAAGSATAVVDGTGEHTYGQILDGALRVAGALVTDGAVPGERIAVYLPPGAPFVEALYGVFLAGGCAVVLSPLHPPAELAYFCSDGGVTRILTGEPLEERLGGVAEGRRLLRPRDLPGASSTTVLPVVGTEAPALQLYTSGTTGKPKGAVLTHGNLGTQQELLRGAWAFGPGDVLLHALPLHHLHGLGIALLTALGAGATTRLEASFDAERLWELMGMATVFMAVPTMYAKLFAAFDDAPGPTQDRWRAHGRGLRLATSGSAALPVTLADRWRELTGVIPLERFGMTEIGVGLTNPLQGVRRPGRVGHPLPSVKMRIVGENGVDAPTGELWIAGPSVFAGYHGRPEATESAFTVDDEGTRWFRTGDTATRDEGGGEGARTGDGSVRLLGRTSVDILKSGGYKLSALEIEEVLREHPAVGEVAVVGVADEQWGDRVVACVVPKAGRGADCTEASLRAFAKERVAPYKVPRAVVVMDTLPRNAMGKVQKPELSRLMAARTPASDR